uniref:PSI domain-containing protein n=1 Tax=Amphora coffeiformis TaxID=265554 RepID=A0A7S3LCR6_9STRA
MNYFLSLVCLVTLSCSWQAAAQGSTPETRQVQARVFDRYFPETDECRNDDGTVGPCDTSRFPSCDPDTELICYNRRPRSDAMYADIRLPKFFIDYQSVFCYSNEWGGCSSCHPGRLCLSESRCILDEQNYPCERWF